jgi:hypothetical protein
MQFYYGDQNLLRVLDEAEFWKRQEAEHTVVIREIVPGLEANYVNRLQVFERAFEQTEQKAVQLTETVIRSQAQLNPAITEHIMEFLHYALQESEQFTNFLRNLLTASDVVSNNMVAQVVINHIIRESEYFIGITQTILYQE